MLELVIFPEYYGTNPDLAGWSWSTETRAPVFLSFYFFVEPYVLPFVVHLILLVIPKMHDAQRGTSSFKSLNVDGRTPRVASINMYLGWR